MSISSINNSTVSGAVNTTSTTSTSSNSALTMDDFFTLMVEQLKNQDMYNTQDSTQYIAQMAQFSMVQALADLSAASQTSYGVSLIGKEVNLAVSNDDGTISTHTGIVDSVNLYNGSAQVVVDDQTYDLSSVMSVQEPKIIIPTNDNNDSESTE